MTHVAYSWSSFSTKCRDAVLGQAFPGVTLCDAENSHPLKPSGLGCLHMNEPGLFSVMQMARQPSFLANEGKRFHCAQETQGFPREMWHRVLHQQWGQAETCTATVPPQLLSDRPQPRPHWVRFQRSTKKSPAASTRFGPTGFCKCRWQTRAGTWAPGREKRALSASSACYLGTFASKKWDHNNSHFFYDGC